MRRLSLERAGTAALALIALIAVAMALYVQLSERRSREDADRLLAAAARREAELAALRADAEGEPSTPLQEISPEQPRDQPRPGTVLRRGESDGGRSLQQVLDSRDAQKVALVELQEAIAALERGTELSDRALRRELEELRAEVRRGQDVSAKVQTLLLVALIPLLLHLLASLWPRGGRNQGEE